MSWTDEQIDLLQKLWLQGMSASRIAKELANGVTRNAVIGKVYRLGLSGRPKAAASGGAAQSPRPQKAAPQPQSPRPQTLVIQGNTALVAQAEPMAAPEPVLGRKAEVVIALCEPVTIADLRETMCRWPIGDPTAAEFRFCGAKKLPGVGPYCACHAGVAYQPQHDRRRERRVGKPA